ncbi:outer membrane protein assembly factor BamB [Arthrobacter pigmenti]|uniref:Outer membrane protein assembly factor BamB n=1 Tax=Arthrobacter pigmenti TaxID=271432 RepID=A0A846RIZ3_9MICC|nr:PQQ-binding-like beta-propeller repeat protein [Arthrobacter pigmenti]NJC21149.1 outer membrane protein assembly factor BamB [Arthrobacter pigmenti]
MTPQPMIDRRRILQLTGVTGAALATGALSLSPASANPFRTGPVIEDLGAASTKLGLYRGVVAGDVLYCGSRNMDPPVVFGVNLRTGQAVSESPLGYMNAVMAMATDPTGRYVYAGGDHNKVETTGNLYRIDVTDPEKKAQDIARRPEENLQSVTVAPDGMVFFAGRWNPTTAYQWDPATGETTLLGSMPSNLDRIAAVAATDTTVFAGGVMTLTGGGTQARLFAIDRATGGTTDITPAEVLEAGSGVRDIAVIDGSLFVGVTAFTAPTPLVVMDASNPTSYTVVSVAAKEVREFCKVGDKIYFRGAGLMAYDPQTRKAATLRVPGANLAGMVSVQEWDGKIVVVSTLLHAVVIDPVTLEAREINFLEAGVRPGPQMILGIAAGGGYAYACANAQVTQHNLATGEKIDFPMQGEAKSATFHNGVVWFAQYNGGGLWAHDPRTSTPPSLVAPFPDLQNRLLRVAADPVNNLILVGVQSDRLGGGSLCVYHPDTGSVDVYENPIAKEQLTRAITSHEGIAYLGGENLTSQGSQATVVAFDPVAGRELWRLETGQSRGIGELTVRGRHLYGISHGGGLFIIDLESTSVVHSADISFHSPDQATLVTNQGVVYGVSSKGVFRIHPTNFAPSTLVPGLDGGWYGWPRVGTDEEGRLYTLRERNLIRITDSVATLRADRKGRRSGQ